MKPKTSAPSGPETAAAAALLGKVQALTSAVRPLSDRQRTQLQWTATSRVWVQSQRRRQRWTSVRAALAGAATTALATVAFAHLSANPTPPPTAAVTGPTEVGWQQAELSLGRIYGTSDSDYTVVPEALASRSGETISLSRGLICVEARHRDLAQEGPLWVEAPSLRLRVVGTSFCVSAADSGSTVSVEQGLVEVNGPGGAQTSLGAGGTLVVEALGEAAPLPTAEPLAATRRPPSVRQRAHPPQPLCDGLAFSGRRSCLVEAAAGSGLSAEIALYDLAVLDASASDDLGVSQSLADLYQFQARFPDGQLAPEVKHKLIEQLHRAGDEPEANRQAAEFRARFPWGSVKPGSDPP